MDHFYCCFLRIAISYPPTIGLDHRRTILNAKIMPKKKPKIKVRLFAFPSPCVTLCYSSEPFYYQYFRDFFRKLCAFRFQNVTVGHICREHTVEKGFGSFPRAFPANNKTGCNIMLQQTLSLFSAGNREQRSVKRPGQRTGTGIIFAIYIYLYLYKAMTNRMFYNTIL